MKLNQLKFIHPVISVSACLMLCTVLCITSCKKKDETKPATQNTTQNPVVEPDYILFKGYKMLLRKPKVWEVNVNGGDTVMDWATSIGGFADTIIQFRHPESIKGGANTVVQYAFNLGEVGIFINWGTPGMSPEVALTSGDYKIERINNRWVSTLKNGKGVWVRTSGNVDYTGIEAKVTWPEF